MQSLDLQVIGQLCRWLEQGDEVWFCTVIETWGSSPRRPGSLMVFHPSGVMVGSLSGGCVEDDLLEQLQKGELAAKVSEYKLYGETQEEIERFKLPCGGTLGVLIEPIGPNDVQIFRDIEFALKRRFNVLRHVVWGSGNSINECDQQVDISKLHPCIEFEKDSDSHPSSLKHVYGPETHLFIIGISEVSRALAQFALAAAYKVTVCDPREELAEQWDVENTRLIIDMPDDAIRANLLDNINTDTSSKGTGVRAIAESTIDAHSAIVAVTHDPRIDDMGLMEAFSSSAFYIGAMGSIGSSKNRRERLRQLDIPEDQLSRLHAPIGIEIGSKTPVEIAISIMAELISERAKQQKQSVGK
ncbi:MAG: xanthine dehydrogenase accessory factor [Oceanicoccus sp.]